ncbi:hypothetical protein RJ639_047834 [Escallonia herrerae]|uniref:Uncharacterized protein n=1 Tax=Escallonia herrerae TaxID=1293975 RepID=A0AA88W6D1_9ASTE|nr:hypothetical protein RJ639_047834 [Escallonia herrerae]
MGLGIKWLKIFFNTGEIISRHFLKVLKVACKISEDIIKPDSNYNDVIAEYICTSTPFQCYLYIGAVLEPLMVRMSKLDSHKTNKPNIFGERNFLRKISWLIKALTNTIISPTFVDVIKLHVILENAKRSLTTYTLH